MFPSEISSKTLCLNKELQVLLQRARDRNLRPNLRLNKTTLGSGPLSRLRPRLEIITANNQPFQCKS